MCALFPLLLFLTFFPISHHYTTIFRSPFPSFPYPPPSSAPSSSYNSCPSIFILLSPHSSFMALTLIYCSPLSALLTIPSLLLLHSPHSWPLLITKLHLILFHCNLPLPTLISFTPLSSPFSHLSHSLPSSILLINSLFLLHHSFIFSVPSLYFSLSSFTAIHYPSFSSVHLLLIPPPHVAFILVKIIVQIIRSGSRYRSAGLHYLTLSYIIFLLKHFTKEVFTSLIQLILRFL